jgi:hypothetical protein
MPPQGSMPICPQIVAIAKPKRIKWCLEELLDFATYLEGKVHETSYPGVCLVELENKNDISKINESLRIYKFSFAKRLVITYKCVKERDQLVQIIRDILNIIILLFNINSVRIIYSLRGRSKEYLTKETISILLKEYMLTENRHSHLILDLEGLDKVVALSFGLARSCGYDCLLVKPPTIR